MLDYGVSTRKKVRAIQRQEAENNKRERIVSLILKNRKGSKSDNGQNRNRSPYSQRIIGDG